MGTFTQKQKITQQNTSTKPSVLDPAHLKQSSEVNSILHLQRTVGNQAVQRLVNSSKSSNMANAIQRKEDSRIRRINHIAQSELDRFLPSYKILLSSLITAHKINGLPQLIADLRARYHKEHGTYFEALLRILKSRGSEGILKIAIKLMAKDGIIVHEAVKEYPLRFQIADYISGKIEQAKKNEIGIPKDSIWWVINATLVETFTTMLEGFVDTLRVGKGSEEAARAYAIEKDAVDRWAGTIKGLAEDFLRITVIFAPVGKAITQSGKKAITSQLAGKADDAIAKFGKDMKSASGKGATQAEKQAAKVAQDAAKTTQKRLKSIISEKTKLEIESTAYSPVGKVKTRKPKGFEPTSKGSKKRVKTGTLEGLESSRYKPVPKRRQKSVTREQQLAGIESKSSAKAARAEFEKVRDNYAKRFKLGKGGEVHHAVELQVLDRYPGVFTARELNQFKNMRGIRSELGGQRQLHGSKIREIWDRHYKLIDTKIAKLKLKPGTMAYEKFVRRNVKDAVKEIDYVLGQFFKKARKKVRKVSK